MRSKLSPPESLQANTSGQGKDSPVPLEVKRWNWGAFTFSWLWGLANGVSLGDAMNPLVLGFSGNVLSWQNKRWKSLTYFVKVQRLWSWTGGLLFWGVLGWTLVLFLIALASSPLLK